MLSSLNSPQGLEGSPVVTDPAAVAAVPRPTAADALAASDSGVALNLSPHGLTLARIEAALAESPARRAEDMRPPYLPLEGIADVGRLAQAVQAASATKGEAANPFIGYSSDKLIAMVSEDNRHFYTADEVRAARTLLLDRMQRLADDQASAQARVVAATQSVAIQDAAHDPAAVK